MKHFAHTIILLCAFVFIASGQITMKEKEKKANMDIKPNLNAREIKGNSLQQSSLAKTSYMSPLQRIQTSNNSTLKNIAYYSKTTGLPIFIQLPQGAQQNLRAINSVPIENRNEYYITQLNGLLGLSNAEQQFSIINIEADPLGGRILRLQQQYNAIDIEGCVSLIHINASGLTTSWNGLYIKPESISKKPFTVSSQTATQTALNNIQSNCHYYELSDLEKTFLDYSQPEIKSVYYIDNKITQTCVPAYIINIRPNFVDWWEYVIDAQTGNILSSYSKTCHIDGSRTSTGLDLNGTQQTINTYLKGSTYFAVDVSRNMFDANKSVLPDNPVGAIQTLDLNNTWGRKTSFSSIKSNNNTFTPTTISAQYIAGKAFEYYQEVHNRNSIDGKGNTIISFINVSNPNDGTPMDNAFWNGTAIYYGNGDQYFKPLAGALDVGGHELTHGVIQNTANLSYVGESGAINESFADIFGCMIDSLDWQIGEDVVLTQYYPSGALRSLSDPHNGGTDLNSPGWQPKILSEKYLGLQDNGGVHINSGITNYAFYLLAQSTKRTTAEKIFYRALTTYLVRSSQFIDLRIACIASANDLFGENSNESLETGNAFDAVEITSTSGIPIALQTDDAVINPGDDLILGYNLDNRLQGKVYSLRLNTGTYKAVTTTPLLNKPTITDDGSTIYFVNNFGQIKRVDISAGNSRETFFDKQFIWHNVAISKDGKRLAATTVTQDTSIYVYDFESMNWSIFKLYSPTFSDGIKSGGPIYADAIEWNLTGEQLVFDCYNEVENNDGNNITYWDINFIQIWDNTANTFADGTITKLFPSLPKNISLGNPTFAKNSLNIIAFDYLDESANQLFVTGCNIETNNFNAITQSNVLSYPNFNKYDNQLAYVYQGGLFGNITTIRVIDLDRNKINASATENDREIHANATWPIFYSNGVRSLPTSVIPKQRIAVAQSAIVFPNPSSGDASILIESNQYSNVSLSVTDLNGALIYSQNTTVSIGENNVPFSLPANTPAGFYLISVETDQKKWIGRFVKL